jgi:hypothetical protein
MLFWVLGDDITSYWMAGKGKVPVFPHIVPPSSFFHRYLLSGFSFHTFASTGSFDANAHSACPVRMINPNSLLQPGFKQMTQIQFPGQHISSSH